MKRIYEYCHNKAWIDFIDTRPNTTEQRDEVILAKGYATKLQSSLHKIIGNSSPINRLPAHDTSLSAIGGGKINTISSLSYTADAQTLLKETNSQLEILVNRLNIAAVVMEAATSKKGRKSERGTNQIITNMNKYWEDELGRESRVKHHGIDDSYHGEFLNLINGIFMIVNIPITSKNALGKKIYTLLKREK